MQRRHQLKLHTEVVAPRQRPAKPITPYQSRKTAKVLPDTGQRCEPGARFVVFAAKQISGRVRVSYNQAENDS